jgi:ribonucleotide reductase beta subunit family protein with ferritin-like domain
MNNEEHILVNNPNRFVMFPIKYPKIWEMYQKHVSVFWTPEEVKLIDDLNDWEKLTNDEKYFIKNVLAFFAGSDGIVLENLGQRFMNEVQIPEAKAFYAFQMAMETCHCCTANTQILTKNGYIKLGDAINQDCQVWNGNEFSNVRIQYTGHQAIYNVELSNGMNLECTDGHKWLVRKGNQKHPERCKEVRIETKHLNIGDVIMNYEVPIIEIEDPDEFQNPYIHGFFCGDGTYSNGYPNLQIYGNKQKLMLYLNPDNLSYGINKDNNGYRLYITNYINKDKFFVPINYNLKTKLRWLEGYCDADGCINKSKGFSSIQITSINKEFLKNVQLMLTTMGIISNLKLFQNERIVKIASKYCHCKKIYILYINTKQVYNLVQLGFAPKRLLIKTYKTKPNKPNSRLIKIQSIEKISDNEPTYCFTEPLQNKGLFNGILTGQSITYSLLIDTYIKDANEKDHLFKAIDTIPCVKQKADWALKWIENKDASFATRLVAFGAVEGIFFSGSFCAIFWLRERGLMPGLTFSNELISRDEGLHCQFAILLYSMLKNKLTQNEIHNLIGEAVQIEKNFIIDSLPCRLIGMNSELMSQYIEYVADRYIVQLGYEKLYNTKNPFAFMERISIESKVNFFEARNHSYERAGIMTRQEENDFMEVDF